MQTYTSRYIYMHARACIEPHVYISIHENIHAYMDTKHKDIHIFEYMHTYVSETVQGVYSQEPNQL